MAIDLLEIDFNAGKHWMDRVREDRLAQKREEIRAKQSPVQGSRETWTRIRDNWGKAFGLEEQHPLRAMRHFIHGCARLLAAPL
jgi:hypothetical protein